MGELTVSSIQTLLVANRGEIAVRVMRTAKSLGLRTVAVYSDADADAVHVREADHAERLGPAPVAESYLDAERVLDAARRSGADAVHPGYGFLSENADFARACQKAGVLFVGPTAEAIDVMGNKAEAKRRMIAAGVPCVPGYEGEDQADAAFVAAAAEIGFPVMVKAAAGGGGRGMRLVGDAADLEGALALARSEAENAFGSGELILEKAIVGPRHVEVQVFADTHGSVIHLGERDCSVQRRHQKVIEEAPSPAVDETLRAAMGSAAVEAARAIDYRGAGTVEFLLDADGRFYFLEMNTRLQVEHPVTEKITGLDLVAMQLAVAEGRPLDVEQEDVCLFGHAIEVRLYAEDPSDGFLPSTGTIELWKPATGDDLRIDAGIASGQEVSPFYDPMLAKIIAWGPTRETARRRLLRGLERTAIFGPRTNRDFLIDALGRDRFIDGQATTAFIEQEFGDEDLRAAAPGATQFAVASVLAASMEFDRAFEDAVAVSRPLGRWSSSGALWSLHRYADGDDEVEVAISPHSGGACEVLVGDESLAVRVLERGEDRALLEIAGVREEAAFRRCPPDRMHLSLAGRTWLLTDRNAAAGAAEDEAAAGGQVLAPMHGQLLEILVTAGQRVAKGDRLAVLEAMKMQHEIVAAVDGTVSEVVAEAGTQVAADSLVLSIDVEGGLPEPEGSR